MTETLSHKNLPVLKSLNVYIMYSSVYKCHCDSILKHNMQPVNNYEIIALK